MSKKKGQEGAKEGKKSKAIKKPKSPEINPSLARKVEFSLPGTEAREVCLAGEFNGWDPSSLFMERRLSGEWNAVVPLLPGRYEFKACADGAWLEDVPCTVRIEGESILQDLATEEVINCFGARNFAVWIR